MNATKHGVDMVLAEKDGDGGKLSVQLSYICSTHYSPNLFVQTLFSFLITPINISELIFLRSKFGNTLVLLIPVSHNLTKAGSLRKF